MTDQPQQTNPNEHRYYPDDEIDLMDYLLVLWKWKWRIVLITFVCMVAAGVVSFKMPRIYEVSMVIEPGVTGVQKNGNPIFMDLVNIKGKIENGLYNTRILKRLNINPRSTQLGFKVVNPKNTKFIKISSEWEQEKILTGTKILAQLAAELTYDSEKIIRPIKEDLDKQILLKLSGIQGKKNQIKLQKAILKNIRERKTELIQELKQVKNNTESLIQRKNRIVEGESSEENISLILYFTTVQQNVTYFNQLNDQLNGLKINDNSKVTKIKNFEKNINDIKIEIERLDIKKSYIENIKVLKEPESSESPIKPKKKRNVALAGAVGFMLALFMAFFVEYLQKAREESMIKKDLT